MEVFLEGPGGLKCFKPRKVAHTRLETLDPNPKPHTGVIESLKASLSVGAKGRGHVDRLVGLRF